MRRSAPSIYSPVIVLGSKQAPPENGLATTVSHSWGMDYDRRHFGYLARYNRSANQQLIGYLAALPASELAKARGSYFGSIQGLLNHIITTDINWLRRFRELFSQAPFLLFGLIA
jgi:hypothetical protein